MTRYAESTTVSTEASRMEIERTLRRYKADAFAYATEGRKASIMFQMAARRIRFSIMLPDPNSKEFTQHSRGARTAEAAEKMWEQSCRQKWRALALVIKAKLEAVAAGITTVEDEFLAQTVLPDNTTVGQWAKTQVDQVYLDGKMPPLMIAGPQ